MYIYCDRPSKSAKLLAKALKIKKIRVGEVFNIPATVINWGCSNLMIGLKGVKVVNPPEAIKKAADKLLFFKAMAPLKSTPRFYTTRAEAFEAIQKGRTIVCRTILNGHSGRGIVIANTEDTLVNAQLYVDYVKKDTEWRVHVFNGEVIDVQMKARNRAIPNEKVNWQVRNHANGFIYMRGFNEPFPGFLEHELGPKAIETIKMIGLNFGAVDLIATQLGRVYVLEVNTAPGLEGTTLNNYVKAIKKAYN